MVCVVIDREATYDKVMGVFGFFFSFYARRFENERGLPKVGRTFEARRSRIRSGSCS